MRTFSCLLSWLVLTAVADAAAGTERADALLVIVGDQHSAYERTAQVVAYVDRLRTEDIDRPMAVLVNGDVFEQGNVVARRSAGAIDFAMLTALANRVPTILNLGNHEPEFHDMAETLGRLRAAGVMVVSNIVDRATGLPFAPASTRLKLGNREVVVVGVSTDLLATFRVAVRPALDLANPAVWARKNFPGLFALARVKIVLSHAGLAADREILPLVPDGTLFAGAHDHARFVHRVGRTVYVHSGSWNEFLTLAYLRVKEGGADWEIRQVRIETTDPADPPLAALIQETRQRHLLPEDTAPVGHLAQELSADAVARLAMRATLAAAGVDFAFISRTTFGSGLPAGEITRLALDACVRFDGTIFTGEMNGAQLKGIVSAANETPGTAFAQRRGDFLVAEGFATIESGKIYRIAVSDWISRNPKTYPEFAGVALKEWPDLRLKGIVRAALLPPADRPVGATSPR